MLDLTNALDDLNERGLRRRTRALDEVDGRTAVCKGRTLLNFSSNNYLGLTHHPRVKEAAASAAREFGAGSGASRLISGTLTLHETLEAELAAFKGTEAALVFPTGFMAAIGAVTALCPAPRLIMMDKLNHASLIDGGRLAEQTAPGTALRTWPHGKIITLDGHLDKWSARTRRISDKRPSLPPLIVTDTIFSMDGDLADLPRLSRIARKHGATMMIDEAHGTGVFGTHGRGVAEQFGVEDAIDVHMGTLSKALGGLGGYIAGSRDLIDFLINRARSFIYTTALPPSVVAAARAALAIVSSDEGAALRRRVRQNADRLRGGLRARGLNPGSSASPIVPIILGDNDKTVTAGERLRDAGFLVGAVRPPTVPSGTARLRVSVTAAHTEEDLEGLLKALERVLGDVGSPTAGAGR